jgi:hypothetical protein
MRALWLAALLAACAPVEVELLAGGDGCGGGPRLVAGQCSGAFAAATHRFALCTCQPLSLARLSSSAFSSAGGSAGSIASVGTNGAFAGSDEIDLGGALWAAGAVTVTSHLEVEGSLRAGGPLSAPGAEVDVHGDAFVDGDVSARVRVEGTLHVPSSATIDPDVEAQSVAREEVTVDPPCDCPAALGLDLAGEVGRVRSQNDNGLIGLGTGALAARGRSRPRRWICPAAPTTSIPSTARRSSRCACTDGSSWWSATTWC